MQCERGVFVVHTQGVGEGAGVEPKGAVAGDNITIPRAVWIRYRGRYGPRPKKSTKSVKSTRIHVLTLNPSPIEPRPLTKFLRRCDKDFKGIAASTISSKLSEVANTTDAIW